MDFNLNDRVLSLCQIYRKAHSFNDPETRKVGAEIYSCGGHSAMFEACYAVREELGAGAARELEFRWDGIGDWLG